MPIFKSQLKKGCIEDIRALYQKKYNSELLSYVESADEGGLISSSALSGLDRMQIEVYGCDERILLVARYDNLGKGASGAAVECLNIVLGCEKTKTLEV